MEREIKFRAWDKTDKKMVYTEDVKGDYDMADDECCREYTNIVSPNIFEDSYLAIRRFPCHPFEMEAEEFKGIVMQFTGLLDRNGKEIYESDILSFDLEGFEVKGVVEYIGNGFWIRNERDGNFMPDIKYREVIGNIYESPNLLSEKEE